MYSLIKKIVSNLLNSTGYVLVPAKDFDSLLSESVSLRVSSNDQVQTISDLTQEFVFPALQETSGRDEALASLKGTSVIEALYIVGFLQEVMYLKGDVCEFGVAQGKTSALIANEMRSTDKTLWIFDSFEGLPVPSKEDELIDDIFQLGEMEHYTGQMSCPEQLVNESLNHVNFPTDRRKICKGWIDETIANGIVPSQICFAYLDFDFYEGTKLVLSLIEEKLVPGGVVVVDDYDFFSSGVKKALDQFMLKNYHEFEIISPFNEEYKFRIIRRLLNASESNQNGR